MFRSSVRVWISLRTLMTSTTIGGRVMRPYDPTYDPLVQATPGQGTGYAPTYWVASAGSPPPDDGPVLGDFDADVVVIGSGSTGMSTALYLAREHGIAETTVKIHVQHVLRKLNVSSRVHAAVIASENGLL